MKCRVCGAELKKEGDLCPNCYKELKKEEELRADIKELFVIKRKYKPLFHIRQRWDVTIIAILCIFFSAFGKQWFQMIFSLVLYILIMLGYLAFEKMVSQRERIIFYEKKVVKYSTVPIFGMTKELSYDKLRDIAYYQQTLNQKSNNMGDFIIYAKYTGYFGGLRMNSVENGSEIMQQLYEILPIEFDEN